MRQTQMEKRIEKFLVSADKLYAVRGCFQDASPRDLIGHVKDMIEADIVKGIWSCCRLLNHKVRGCVTGTHTTLRLVCERCGIQYPKDHKHRHKECSYHPGHIETFTFGGVRWSCCGAVGFNNSSLHSKEAERNGAQEWRWGCKTGFHVPTMDPKKALEEAMNTVAPPATTVWVEKVSVLGRSSDSEATRQLVEKPRKKGSSGQPRSRSASPRRELAKPPDDSQGTCTLCGRDYTEETNGPTACHYHAGKFCQQRRIRLRAAAQQCDKECAQSRCKLPCLRKQHSPMVEHNCGGKGCLVPCWVDGCTRNCAHPMHFHEAQPGAVHFCEGDHLCISPCYCGKPCTRNPLEEHVHLCDSRGCTATCSVGDCTEICVDKRHEHPTIADARHHCGATHRCPEKCSGPNCSGYCIETAEEVHTHDCGAVQGKFQLGCLVICSVEACSRRCKSADHLHGTTTKVHHCGEFHVCPERCSAVGCTGTCALSRDTLHKEHMCDETGCRVQCSVKGCTSICSDSNHFHGNDKQNVHNCGEFHSCPGTCAAKQCGKPCAQRRDVGHICNCGTNKGCRQRCFMPGCLRECRNEDHFHAAIDPAAHMCAGEHQCTVTCEAPGKCVRPADDPQAYMRRTCMKVIQPFDGTHAGPHTCGGRHATTNVLVAAPERCKGKCNRKNCQRACALLVDPPHDVHSCEGGACGSRCSFANCNKPCIGSHTHSVGVNKTACSCGRDHKAAPVKRKVIRYKPPTKPYDECPHDGYHCLRRLWSKIPHRRYALEPVRRTWDPCFVPGEEEEDQEDEEDGVCDNPDHHRNDSGRQPQQLSPGKAAEGRQGARGGGAVQPSRPQRAQSAQPSKTPQPGQFSKTQRAAAVQPLRPQPAKPQRAQPALPQRAQAAQASKTQRAQSVQPSRTQRAGPSRPQASRARTLSSDEHSSRPRKAESVPPSRPQASRAVGNEPQPQRPLKAESPQAWRPQASRAQALVSDEPQPHSLGPPRAESPQAWRPQASRAQSDETQWDDQGPSALQSNLPQATNWRPVTDQV